MSSERLREPAPDADASTWREYAAYQSARFEAANETRHAADMRSGALKRAVETLRSSKRRDAGILDALARDLERGDFPGAVDRLARRRAGIDAANTVRRERRADEGYRA